MKLVITIWLLVSMAAGPLQAQEYKVRTDQADSFSVALVRLLNCAAERFRDCTGDSIRTTWLLGTDSRSTVQVPGSVMTIVRGRDWDANVYAEFRGYSDKKTRDQGIRDLVKKIKKALGDQLYDPYENEEQKDIYFYGLSIKDKNGYFSMNMELFGGASSAPIYLLGPENEDDLQIPKNFVLLKIYPGIPNYQYYIRPVAAPDLKLDATLRQLLSVAEKDFESIRDKNADTLIKKRRRTDTIHLNGFNIRMNYRGSNYSANYFIPASGDSVEFRKQWLYYQQALQAALGSRYVYHKYEMDGRPQLVYYEYGSNKPRVYLQLNNEYDRSASIHIRVESAFTHPTRRNLDLDDL